MKRLTMLWVGCTLGGLTVPAWALTPPPQPAPEEIRPIVATASLQPQLVVDQPSMNRFVAYSFSLEEKVDLPAPPTDAIAAQRGKRPTRTERPVWHARGAFVSRSPSQHWLLYTHPVRGRKKALLLYDTQSNISYQIVEQGLSPYLLQTRGPMRLDVACAYPRSKPIAWQWAPSEDILVIQRCTPPARGKKTNKSSASGDPNAMVMVLNMITKTYISVSGTRFWLRPAPSP